ncbi:DarT ssDNA thymidine ADP-ribosyltransferase family protein [Bacillus sp. EB01]|uniref:DarT ssDNA thymidine ADP-ribosyltransferase family protein n=1 Tax=Bacillus sp. EB01 TaxID=1347086 RepID=UPI0005C72151|nr:DarT ssDNA thymidine ADP-ribosyltransferase family protein [Bacillus sp. EB01]
MSSKKNREQYKQVIDGLISGEISSGLSPLKRKWIPKYVYHFTDLANAKNILTEGFVYSRKKATELGLMQVDNASSDVIDYTTDSWKSYARFYFRPKTPTQYNNEGIRASNQITELKAHCPVPVFFLFDSVSMLTMDESKFSYGNLAVNDTVYSDIESFKNMPFSSVYHEGYYDTFLQSHIKFNRHAELIVPEKCSLQHLKRIVCRSAAEKETFLNVLDWKTQDKYKDIIVVDTRTNFFEGKWTYIDEVSLTKEKITITFNVCSRKVHFNAYLKIIEKQTDINYTWSNEEYEPKRTKAFNIENLKYPEFYEVEFYLDDNLAYKNYFMDDDYLPF